jgi:hypothetical protein
MIKLDIQLFGGRGASSSAGAGSATKYTRNSYEYKELTKRFNLSEFEKSMFEREGSNFYLSGNLMQGQKGKYIYKYRIYQKDNKIRYQIKQGNKIVLDTLNKNTINNKILRLLNK